jgi:hypothetical protein
MVMMHSWLFFFFELKRLDVHKLEFVLPFGDLQELVRSYIPIERYRRPAI